MIRQFFRSGSDITWPNFTNARCLQVSHDSLQAYYITTQARYSTDNITEHRKSAINSTL
jgi:hypothetical protein